MEDISIKDTPRWVKRFPNWDQRTGGYSMDSLSECPESIRGVFKHTRGGYDAYSEEKDAQWRYENLTIEGLAIKSQKHAGKNLSHPLNWLLGMKSGDSMYTQTRSDTWNVQIGLQNVASLCLQNSIEHLRSGQEDEIWRELAPIREIDENRPNTYFWTTNFYEANMAVQTTQRGLPNVVEAQIRTGVGKLNYYKIKGQIFLNFYKSEMGSAHWHHVLIAMARGLVLAGQYAAAVKLASADKEYEDRIRQDGAFLPTFDSYWDNVADFWAYFQRPNHTNVAALRTQFENKLLVQGAHPGKYHWLITKATYDCIAKFDRDNLKQNVTSERGLDLLESHLADKVILASDPVYVMSPFVLPRRILDQPFGQPIQIAEHFEMFKETGNGENTFSRFIFDMTTKTFRKITLDHALDHLVNCPFDGTGNVDPIGPMETIESPRDKLNWSYFPFTNNEGATTVARFPGNKADVKAAILAGTYGILGIRCHETYFTDNSYYHLPGTVVERAQKSGEAIISDIAPEFIHEITVEALLGAATINPQNIVRAPNTTITGYVSGEGTKPINTNGYDPHAETIDGDIIYVLVPGNWKIEDVPRNINLHGNLDILNSEYGQDSDDQFANWYPGCAAVNAMMKWRAHKTGIPSRRYYERARRKVPFPAAVCSRRMTYYLADEAGMPTYLRAGNGFWGMDATYHTCGNKRIGGTFSQHPERGSSVTLVNG